MAMPGWSQVALGLSLAPLIPSHLPPRPVPAAPPFPEGKIQVFVGPTLLPAFEEEIITLAPARSKAFAESVFDETEGRVGVVGDVDAELVARREAWLSAQGPDLLSGGRYYPPPKDDPELPAAVPRFFWTQHAGSVAGIPVKHGGRRPVRNVVHVPMPGSGAGASSGISAGAIAAVSGKSYAAESIPVPAKAGSPISLKPRLLKLFSHTFDANAPYGSRNVMTYRGADGEELVVKASPLIFDLGGKGLHTGVRRVKYDILGEKSLRVISDVGEGVGILAIRRAENGLSLFGDRSDLDGDGKPDGHEDGFAALAAFVEKAGIDKKELGPAELALLEKEHGLVMVVGGFGGRIVPLAKAGVCGITLSSSETVVVDKDFDGLKNDLQKQDGAVFARCSGGKGRYADLWLMARKPRR